MKILYSVQATGNGHISRATELWPELSKHGQVDILLSGSNCDLQTNMPVRYRTKGLSLFYNCTGGLDYWQILKGIQPWRIRQEIRDLPVEKYDLIINDYDYITSAACSRKGIPSVHIGHQASFQSAKVPRPEVKSFMGELILKNFVKATCYTGIHFKKYDDFISPAIVRKEILQAKEINKDHITVYLPSWNEEQLTRIFSQLKRFTFHIFCRSSKTIRKENNILFLPVNKMLFSNSLIECAGIVTGGGFETPAEALHLGKRILSIPIRGQYEQQCNAAALKQLGAYMITQPDEHFYREFYTWINAPAPSRIDYSGSAPLLMDHIFTQFEKLQRRTA